MSRGVIVEFTGEKFVIQEGENRRRGVRSELHEGYTPTVGDEVEFEWAKGQAKKVRPVGVEFVRAAPPAAAVAEAAVTSIVPPRSGRGARDFRNPKNFVPTPRRPAVGPMADGVRWHDRWHAGHVSGSITVNATVLTPLLVLDATRASLSSSGHRTMGIRMQGDGAMIPATTLKGSLRSLVEAATNSRMAVFTQRSRYGYRRNANASQLVPARVEAQDGELVLRLMPGAQRIAEPKSDRDDRRGPPAAALQHGAWVAMGGEVASLHGRQVRAELRLFDHMRNGRSTFRVYRAVSVTADGKSVGLDSRERATLVPVKGASALTVDGYVCATGKIAMNKHDERIFFAAPNNPSVVVPLTTEVRLEWSRLLENYRTVNERALRKGAKSPGGEWGRHVKDKSMETLKDGDLVYAEVARTKDEMSVTAIYPAQLTRAFDAAAPVELLRADLRPAHTVSELSPAERMFGWVAGSAADVAGIRGRVAIDDAYLPAPERFAKPKPLAILSSPKPEQARFYLGIESDLGTSVPFDDGVDKAEVRYERKRAKQPRGRAVYLRHDRVEPAEAFRAGAQTDDQNISISGEIPVGTTFTFTLQVDDLSMEELGALLWVLDNRADDRSISLGHGKPLGFGSVQTEVAATALMRTEALSERLLSWGTAPSDEAVAAEAIAAFKLATTSAVNAPPEDFRLVPHIHALMVATGAPGELPIHYPRRTSRIDPDGKNFEWFTQNERPQRGGPERGFSLPDLRDDIGLPYFP